MGLIDRIIRVLLAVVVGIFILTGQLNGVAAIVLGILAVVFLLTSAVAFCPLYVPFHVSTKKKE